MEIFGEAEKVLDLGHSEGWHDGTVLYKVTPPVTIMNGELKTTEYVIVAVAPETGDHGQPETKCFAANSDNTCHVLSVELSSSTSTSKSGYCFSSKDDTQAAILSSSFRAGTNTDAGGKFDGMG